MRTVRLLPDGKELVTIPVLNRGTRAMLTAHGMGNAGRIVIDADGVIIEADDAFTAAMRAGTAMIGVNALDSTAPGDRDRCAALMAALFEDGQPVTTVKRMIRADGTHLWVRNHLVRVSRGGRWAIEVGLQRCVPPPGWVEPSVLLRTARTVFHSRRARTASFGVTLFGDHAWDVLLAAYICEAEGSVVTIARLHAWTGIPLTTASRWIRALGAEALVEYEGGGNHQLVTTPFRLTSAAHNKFERYLSDVHKNDAVGDQVALG